MYNHIDGGNLEFTSRQQLYFSVFVRVLGSISRIESFEERISADHALELVYFILPGRNEGDAHCPRLWILPNLIVTSEGTPI